MPFPEMQMPKDLFSCRIPNTVAASRASVRRPLIGILDKSVSGSGNSILRWPATLSGEADKQQVGERRNRTAADGRQRPIGGW